MMKVSKLGLVAAAFVASSMLVVGCGGKTADRAPSMGSWQGDPDAQDVITKENFDGLRPGLSLGEMEAMYGKATLVHQSIVDGVYSSTYRFQDGPKTVDATFTHENWLNNPISCPKLASMEFGEMPMVGHRVVK